jgi:hypothetical protein
MDIGRMDMDLVATVAASGLEAVVVDIMVAVVGMVVVGMEEEADIIDLHAL